jgi:ribose 1,5-bisphosphokinase
MTPPPIAHSERLLVVVGPSGAGKDSVLASWRASVSGNRLHFAQRVITRPRDITESHEPVSEAEFAELRDHGELATWWSANGLLYGVRCREFEALGRGAWVVMNGSRAHLPRLRQQAPGLHAVTITASPEVLARRLHARGREDASARRSRLARHVDVPVSLSLRNEGDLSATVNAIHDWWHSIASA